MWRSLVGAGVLVDRDRRVLMVARTRDGLTRWELPSGRIEAGESLEETAAREALEETGIAVVVGALLCTVVIDVPAQEYRGINAYFTAEPLDDAEPAPTPGAIEPIQRAAYLELATLDEPSVHPVDWSILTAWRRQPDSSPFHVAIAL